MSSGENLRGTSNLVARPFHVKEPFFFFWDEARCVPAAWNDLNGLRLQKQERQPEGNPQARRRASAESQGARLLE